MSGNNEKIKFSLTLEFNDYKEFNVFTNRRKLFVSFFLYFVFVFFILYFGDIVKNQDVMGKTLVSLAFSFLIALIFLGIMNMSIKSKAKKLYANNKALRYTQKYSIDKDGIHSKWQSGEGTVEWGQVMKISKNKKAMYIFISAKEAVIIPYRVFNSSKDIEQLNSLVSECIAK